jgi:hypothetical protein
LHLGCAQGSRIASDQNAGISSLINNRNFVFKARTASPVGGSITTLTTDYDLRVNNDTVRAFLPYFGRAFTAPINPTNGGINFTSTNSVFQVKAGKKGRVEIVITPQDQPDVRQLLLNVNEDGYASLQVTSNTRQTISFNGVVIAP